MKMLAVFFHASRGRLAKYPRLSHALKKLLSRLYILMHAFSYFRFLVRRNRPIPSRDMIYDFVFVLNEKSGGWILEAICREIARYFPGTHVFHYSPYFLPRGKAYFFSHHSLLPASLKYNSRVWGGKRIVLFTHPRDLDMMEGDLFFSLKRANQIISLCSEMVNFLVKKGVAKEKISLIPVSADPEIFHPHIRSGNGLVGFSMAYYERKNPDLVFSIVKNMPHRWFLLLGRKWKNYPRFQELIGFEHFSYVEAEYQNYPSYYAKMDVFVSPAKLESGPVPLVEAMMSNVFPVASKTGLALDIIRHGENGFLFDTDAKMEDVCLLIDEAFKMKGHVSESVRHLTWKNFALRVHALAGFLYADMSSPLFNGISSKFEIGVEK